MEAKNTMSISEARKRIFELAKEAQKPGVYFTFTEKGRPKVVLMSAEEFESWRETLEVMREFPNLDKDVKEAEKEYRNGDFITLEELLEKEAMAVADNAKKYGASNNRSKKSSKRA